MVLVNTDFFFRRLYNDIESFYTNVYMPEVFDHTKYLHLNLFNDSYERDRFLGLKGIELRLEKDKFLSELQAVVNDLMEG